MTPPEQLDHIGPEDGRKFLSLNLRPEQAEIVFPAIAYEMHLYDYKTVEDAITNICFQYTQGRRKFEEELNHVLPQ